MVFYFILKNNGFDWNKAKKIFYSLTEENIIWIARMIKKEVNRSNRQSLNREYETIKSFSFR